MKIRLGFSPVFVELLILYKNLDIIYFAIETCLMISYLGLICDLRC